MPLKYFDTNYVRIHSIQCDATSYLFYFVIEIISNQSFIIFWIGNVRHNWKIMRHARFIFGARMNNFHYKKELPKVPKFKAYTKLYYILFSKEWNFFAHFGSFSCFLFFFLHFFSFLGSDEVSVNATKRNNFNFTFL